MWHFIIILCARGAGLLPHYACEGDHHFYVYDERRFVNEEECLQVMDRGLDRLVIRPGWVRQVVGGFCVDQNVNHGPERD
jgi:hypothetical protein